MGIALSYQISMGRKKQTPGPGELVQGTLDMLILKVLSLGRMHGWGIAERIRQVSGEILRVEEGSLYPALRRLELDGLITAEWGASDNNRRARFYQLTTAGRRRLADERTHWRTVAAAIARVMETTS
jgi:PadR family transcriptional regulator